jgi:hypothetical protein
VSGLKAGGVGAGVERFRDLSEARLDAAALCAWKTRQQAAHFVAGALGAGVKLAGSREAQGRLEPAGDQFHELTVRFRAKFHEFRALLPGVHVFGLPALLDERTWGFD